MLQRLFVACSISLLALLPVDATAAPFRPQPNPSWAELYHESLVISNLTNPALRNLWITHAYYQNSLHFKKLLGVDQGTVGSHTQGNWPTIATWASNSVGMSIRNETLIDWVTEVFAKWPKVVRELIDKLGPDWIDKLPIIQDMFAVMSKNLAEGNLIVFHEVGSTFSLFGMYFNGTTAKNTTLYSEFDARVPKELPYLAEAMRHYYDAMWSTGSLTDRAQLIAWANFLTGLHEQTRLQPYIADAFPPSFNITIFGKTIHIDMDVLTTKLLISLALADEVVWPGQDLPPRHDGSFWIPELDQLQQGPAALYKQLVVDVGGDWNDTQGTAASSWSSLAQRMRYVTPLFRSRNGNPAADCSPFSAANLEVMERGEVPAEADFCIANCCKQ